MTKNELLKSLEPFKDDVEICIAIDFNGFIMHKSVEIVHHFYTPDHPDEIWLLSSPMKSHGNYELKRIQ